MTSYDIPDLFADPTENAEQDETKRQKALVRSRLIHVVDALDEYKLISDEDKEYIPDSQSQHHEALLQAVQNGIDPNEVFLTLSHDIQTLSAVVPDYYAFGAEPYKESGLLIPKSAGKLAVMITGDHGDFKQSPNSAGLYLTNLDWQKQVKWYPKLLAAIKKDAPHGITNISNMTAGHTVARDIQRPTGANRTNYSSTDGSQVQRHLELDEVRPADRFQGSCAFDDDSYFYGGYSWWTWYAALSNNGVRSAGELEDPQD
jgi:hypothetical protein